MKQNNTWLRCKLWMRAGRGASVYLYGQPVNMRLPFDGLYALARHVMHLDPLSGHLFAFINRRATQIRVVDHSVPRLALAEWDGSIEGRDNYDNYIGEAGCRQDARHPLLSITCAQVLTDLFLPRAVLLTVLVPDRRHFPASRRRKAGDSARRHRLERHG